MRARFKNARKVIALDKIIILTVLLIIFLTCTNIFKFNKKISPKVLMVAEDSINRLNETLLTNYRVSNVFKKIDLKDIIIISKNKNDEIISVDFDLENVYEVLALVTNYLRDSLEDDDVRRDVLKYYKSNISSDVNDIVIFVPIGVASENIYFANLGPKIPVKISYLGYIASSVSIKINDYGINNALVSVYVDCTIANEFIIPTIKDEIKHDYSILIASKIIQGTVPSYYGGQLESKSNIINIPMK